MIETGISLQFDCETDGCGAKPSVKHTLNEWLALVEAGAVSVYCIACNKGRLLHIKTTLNARHGLNRSRNSTGNFRVRCPFVKPRLLPSRLAGR